MKLMRIALVDANISIRQNLPSNSLRSVLPDTDHRIRILDCLHDNTDFRDSEGDVPGNIVHVPAPKNQRKDPNENTYLGRACNDNDPEGEGCRP